MIGQLTHVNGLHRTAEVPTEFVGASLDDRVMRHADDSAVCAVEGNRDPGGFLNQAFQLFLKGSCRSVHESASARSRNGRLDCQVAALYHKTVGFQY